MEKITIEEIEKIFFDLSEDAKVGATWNSEEFVYVKYDLFINNELYNQNLDETYLGNPNDNKEYEMEDSNGTAQYMPQLIIRNKEQFFSKLKQCIEKYIEIYKFDKKLNKTNKKIIIKEIIITLISNARYVDYQNFEQYLEKVICFFNDKTLNEFNNKTIAQNIEILENSDIIAHNKLDTPGYETPYCFNIYLKKHEEKYYFPVINYGIIDDICYIYSIQNKNQNEKGIYQKKIHRILYKIISEEMGYNENNMLLPAPATLLCISIFLKILKEKNIKKIHFITLLPDRYFEKLSLSNPKADIIQQNLTEKNIMLFYLQKTIYPNIEISFPLYEGTATMEDGDDLIIDISKLNEINNKFIDNIINIIEKKEKKHK